MSTEILQQLKASMEEEKRLKSRLQKLAADAKQSGYTWQEIGDAAGISKQVAHTRWNEKGKKASRNQQRRVRAAARGEMITDDDAMVRKP